ncbi:unnamed protein product [Clavelina lepadiformis]|uniref:GDP-fucose pyrophosphorylase domain-containing protein n=1 Tax=Clavelina lepadiformis TaxID=159417 RepID=A0ABP0GH88_CLALP
MKLQREQRDVAAPQYPRSVLWKRFRDLKLKALIVESAKCGDLGVEQSAAEYYQMLREFLPIPGFKSSDVVYSHVESGGIIGENVLMINTIIERGAFIGGGATIAHSHVSGNVSIGNGCFIYGLKEATGKLINTAVPDNSVVVGISLDLNVSGQDRLYTRIRSDGDMQQNTSPEHQDLKQLIDNKKKCFLGGLLACFILMFVLASRHHTLLCILDDVAISRPPTATRVFSCVADSPRVMAGSKVGLMKQSGSAANADKEWKRGLGLIQKGDMETGDVWYIAECPASGNISGTWTDLPPVCYQTGGFVVNAAALVDGERPIRARTRKIKNPKILLAVLDHDEVTRHVTDCTNLDHLREYSKPYEQSALLKACIVHTKLVDLDSKASLEEQLASLGASGVLAGAVLKVLYRAPGVMLDSSSMIHSVLLVEQMLTSGKDGRMRTGVCSVGSRPEGPV